MKRIRTYVVLGTVLLLFISSGQAAERDVISVTSRKNGHHNLYFMNIQGEILRHITLKTPSMYGHTWSPDGGSFAYLSNKDGNNEIYVMDIRKKTPPSIDTPSWWRFSTCLVSQWKMDNFCFQSSGKG